MRSVVLVTGGSGFIGSHVVDRLAAAGHQPRILDTRPSPWHDDVDTVIGDIRHLDDVRRAMRGCDAVCHLAAAADVSEVHAHPAWATELNSVGTLNVLEAAREADVRRVVYASTVWVYSDCDAEQVVDEETLLPHPAHLYTAGKLSGELYCRSYAELYGLQPTIVRFGIPYGPRCRPAAVIPQFVDRALRGEPLTIAGTGEQQRSFVFVEDLADGVVRALAPHAAGRTYNLAGLETTTIRELAEIVCDEVAATPIVHTAGRSGDLRGTRVASDRAAQELGWRATTPLREGVRRYASWCREHDGAPAAAPVPAIAAPARNRTLGTLVRAAAANQVAIGAVALIAVASACVAVVLGAREEAQSADFAVLGLALLMPLWALTTSAWPPEMRRLQGAVTAMMAALAILVLGALSATTSLTGLPHRSIAFALVASGALTAALRVVPRRQAWDS